MGKLDFINKLENDLVELKKSEHAFEIEVYHRRDSANDEFWLRGAEISRAIISVRGNLAKLKREVGNYPVHVDVPSALR